MSREFRLPDLGEGIHEGEVLRILVSEGDEVKEGDPIIEVETDKAAVEIPSPYTGKVEKIHVKQGDTIKVGDVLMTFSNGAPAEKAPAETAMEKPVQAVEPMAHEKAAGPEEGPVPASPATRRLARELGVDLRKVIPTGSEGLVTAQDVKSFAEKVKGERPEKKVLAREEKIEPQARPPEITLPPLPDFSRWGPVERIPLRSIRKATARQMTLAWSQIPHVHNQDLVDVTLLEEFRRRHRADVENKGGRLTLTVFVLKAVATALKTHPKFNATLNTGSGEIVIKHYYHLGVAVNTEEGLVVPVIRDVDRKSIADLAIELMDMVERTRTRKISLEEMQGGTFTITNVGPMGGGFFAPIINYPEVAILGMGASRMHPVAKENSKGQYEVIPRLMMPLVLSIDHRVLDGADAMGFMSLLMNVLEDPDELFIKMI